MSLSCQRSYEELISSSFRYFATVRRAILIPRFCEKLRELLIREVLYSVCRVPEKDLLDDLFDPFLREPGSGRARPADGVGEEILELEDSPLGLDVLVRRDPGNRRLVNSDLAGDILERERYQVLRVPCGRNPSGTPPATRVTFRSVWFRWWMLRMNHCASRRFAVQVLLELPFLAFLFGRELREEVGSMPRTGISSSFRTMTNSPSFSLISRVGRDVGGATRWSRAAGIRVERPDRDQRARISSSFRFIFRAISPSFSFSRRSSSSRAPRPVPSGASGSSCAWTRRDSRSRPDAGSGRLEVRMSSHHLPQRIVSCSGNRIRGSLDMESVVVEVADQELADAEPALGRDRLKAQLPDQVVVERLRAGRGLPRESGAWNLRRCRCRRCGSTRGRRCFRRPRTLPIRTAFSEPLRSRRLERSSITSRAGFFSSSSCNSRTSGPVGHRHQLDRLIQLGAHF